jgi:hypothetical protein
LKRMIHLSKNGGQETLTAELRLNL